MDVELREVRDFLAAHQPFADLPPDVLDQLPSRLQLRYHRRGTVLLEAGRPNNSLYVLRSGAVDIVDTAGALVERTEPGGSFGGSSLLAHAPSRYTISTIEDSLVLVMPGAVFDHLVAHHEQVRTFYDQLGRNRLRHAVAAQQSTQERSAAWLRMRVEELCSREVVACSPATSIQDAARLMSERRVSALLVLDDGQRLAGIVTDRDLRAKVVAQALDVARPVAEVMTAQPVQVSPATQAFEALLEMTTRGVHHLPVVDDDRVLGVVTSGDIVRLQQADPVFLVGDLGKARGVEQLAAVARRSSGLAARLLQQDASSDDVGRVLTTVADATTRRLVDLAIADLGPAPGPWAWVTLGSQGRRELSVTSDQDHAIVMADELEHDPDAQRWFAELASRVTDGLERCGQVRCPGDVMSTNPSWRLSVQQWQRQFAHWVNQPDPQAVLNSQIFFDARTVVGDAALFGQVRATTLALTPRAPRFLGQLAAQAVERQPPVGFFRGRVLARRGDEHDSFDLKAHGVHAVIETARVHALAHGIDAVGTLDRLHAVARTTDSQHLSDLADAFEFLGHVRLQHQVAQLQRGEQPDNVVRADELSPFDRRHLKDAFQLVRQAQEGLSYSFQTHLMT